MFEQETYTKTPNLGVSAYTYIETYIDDPLELIPHRQLLVFCVDVYLLTLFYFLSLPLFWAPGDALRDEVYPRGSSNNLEVVRAILEAWVGPTKPEINVMGLVLKFEHRHS